MLLTLQVKVGDWVSRNFPDTFSDPFCQLVGLIEKVGELSHALLKQRQRIRCDEDLVVAEKDAIGDIVIYLAAYCEARNLSLYDCIVETWNKVQERNSIENPVSGQTI